MTPSPASPSRWRGFVCCIFMLHLLSVNMMDWNTRVRPGQLDIVAYRWQPFVQTIRFENVDFTGATFRMQVSTYKDALEAPLISLTNSAAPSQGISVQVSVVDGVTVSDVTIRIDKATIDATAPFYGSTRAPGSDARVRYDLHVQPSGKLDMRWIEGEFIIAAGVTK